MKARLDWNGDLRFSGSVDETPVGLDGDAATAPSPVQLLTAALAGCMAIDVVHTLEKMRTPAESLAIDIEIERADTPPRRVVSAELVFRVTGDVPDKNVARAIELSRRTYCSVWHSMREDTELITSYEILEP